MGILPENDDMTSPAFERLGQFVHQQRQQGTTQATGPNFEVFERELPGHMMALERELIAEELARYDVEGEAVEVEGMV